MRRGTWCAAGLGRCKDPALLLGVKPVMLMQAHMVNAYDHDNARWQATFSSEPAATPPVGGAP